MTTKGVAISLVSRSQMTVLKEIEAHINRKLINKPLPAIKDLDQYNSPKNKQDRNDRDDNQISRARNHDAHPRSRSHEQKGQLRNLETSDRSKSSERHRSSERSRKPKRSDDSNRSKPSMRPRTSDKTADPSSKRKRKKPVEEKFTTKIIPINQKSQQKS